MLSQTWCQIKMFKLQTKYYKERLLQLVVNNGKMVRAKKISL